MNDDRTTSLDRLETQLGRLLQAGVLSSAACLAVGPGVWMTAGAHRARRTSL